MWAGGREPSSSEDYRVTYETGGRAEQAQSLAGKFGSVKITTLEKVKGCTRERSRGGVGCRWHGSASDQLCDLTQACSLSGSQFPLLRKTRGWNGWFLGSLLALNLQDSRGWRMGTCSTAHAQM